jgi:hypothetical protein
MSCPFNNSRCLCAYCRKRTRCEDGCKDCIEENEDVKETILCVRFKAIQKRKEEGG